MPKLSRLSCLPFAAALLATCDRPLPEIPETQTPRRADGDSIFSVCGRPAWAPDGQRLAFSYDDDEDGLVELYVAGADGGGLRRLAGGVAGGAAPQEEGEIGEWHGPSMPAWSPDGRRIVFNAMTLQPELDPRTVRTTEWQAGLYLVEVETGEVRPLHDAFALGAAPAWSPDGTRIVFSRTEANEFGEAQPDLFEFVVASGEARRLTNDSQFEREPAFSPDGKHIAYTVSVFAPGHPDFDEDVAVAKADGSEPRLLLDSIAVERSPAWSPDGAAIAVAMGGRGGPGLAIVPAAGGTPRPLGGDQSGMQAATQPAWSPDGTRIAFCAPGEARFGLYVIPAHGVGRRGVFEAPVGAGEVEDEL